MQTTAQGYRRLDQVAPNTAQSGVLVSTRRRVYQKRVPSLQERNLMINLLDLMRQTSISEEKGGVSARIPEQVVEEKIESDPKVNAITDWQAKKKRACSNLISHIKVRLTDEHKADLILKSEDPYDCTELLEKVNLHITRIKKEMNDEFAAADDPEKVVLLEMMGPYFYTVGLLVSELKKCCLGLSQAIESLPTLELDVLDCSQEIYEASEALVKLAASKPLVENPKIREEFEADMAIILKEALIRARRFHLRTKKKGSKKVIRVVSELKKIARSKVVDFNCASLTVNNKGIYTGLIEILAKINTKYNGSLNFSETYYEIAEKLGFADIEGVEELD